jgi:peptidoglycan/xylan/chitin deacetylase (PgdA/CDA1 family)
MKPLDFIVHALSRRAARPLFRSMMRGRATIFMLHRVADTAHGVSGHSLEFVRAAIRALRQSGAQFVPVRRIMEACANGTESGDDWVAFTIDDGFADQAMMARSVFAAEHCPVTVFLISGLVDGQLWPWDDRLAYAIGRTQAAQLDVTLETKHLRLPLQSVQQRSHSLEQLRNHCKRLVNSDVYAVADAVARQLGVTLPDTAPPAYRPLTWDEARALESQGVEFAPHSISHRIFSRLSAAQAREEITQSWRRLQEELAHPLPLFAWPTGRPEDYTERDVALVRDAGLQACASTDADYTHTDPLTGHVHGLCNLRRFPLPMRIRDVLQYGSWIERGKQILRNALPGR